MKTKCLYHPEELITNFCRDKDCLMPLCPYCIAEHTEFHQSERTRPQYTTLNEVINDVNSLVSSFVECLLYGRKRNNSLIKNIGNLEQKVQYKIKNAKNLVYKAVEESFEVLHEQVMENLEKLHEEYSIYSLKKSYKQEKMIQYYLYELEAVQSSMKTERALSNIIFFLKYKYDDISSFNSYLMSYFQKNENYCPKVYINQETIYSLYTLLLRMVKVYQPNLRKYPLQQLMGNSRISPIRYEKKCVSPIKYSRIDKQKETTRKVYSQLLAYSPCRFYGGKKKTMKIDDRDSPFFRKSPQIIDTYKKSRVVSRVK